MDHERLFRLIYPQLFRYLHRLTGDADAADDAAQEAFVRLTSQTIAENDVRPWVFTVATNLIRDGARKADRHRRLESRVPHAEPAALPDTVTERNEAVAAVRRALDLLPERDRTMLLMREEGFRYDEIARSVGVAPSSVGTLLARAGRRFAAAFRTVPTGRETIHETSS
jgi:RNA polymerase sigma-70 factor, ECF subfamily